MPKVRISSVRGLSDFGTWIRSQTWGDWSNNPDDLCFTKIGVVSKSPVILYAFWKHNLEAAKCIKVSGPHMQFYWAEFNQSEDGHDIVLYKLNQVSAFRFCVSTEEASTELANAYVWTHTLKHVSLSPLMLTSLNVFFDGKPLAFSPKNIYGFPVAVPLTQSWEPQMPGDTMGTLSAWSSSFLISLEELCERFSHLRRDPSVYYKSIWIIGKSCKILFFFGFNSSTKTLSICQDLLNSNCSRTKSSNIRSPTHMFVN